MNMKRYIILLAVLLAAASCAKVEQDSKDPEPAQKGVEVTFSADTDIVTRTTLGEDWNVTWNEGDLVSILWEGGSCIVPAQIVDGKVLFKATVEEADEYYAVYPSTITAKVEADGRLTLHLPASQTGKFEDCAVIASHTTWEEKNFGRFKSAVGMIRFTIDDETLTRAIFSSTDDKMNIVGSISTDAGCSDFTTEGTQPEIEVNLDGSGTYFLATLPGVSLPGLYFKLGDNNLWKGEATSDKPATIPAGNVLCIDTPVNGHMEALGNFYITVTGSGTKDGTSWENAGDQAQLITYLSDPAQGAALHGHTIFVGEGEYDLAGAEGSAISVKYDTPTILFVSGVEGKTIFKTSAADECILACASSNVNLTLKGITFADAKHNGAGGALNLTAGHFDIQHCIFSGNATTSATNEQTGGAIYLGGTSAANISYCSFIGNKTAKTGGGAIAIYSAGITRILNCLFRGNNPDKIGNGGAILQKKTGNTLFIANCTFDENACATNGPDIFSSAGDALLIYNCTMVNPMGNNAASNGSIRANVPMLLANCTMAAAKVGTTNGFAGFYKKDEKLNMIVNNLIVVDEGSSIAKAVASGANTIVTTYGHNVLSKTPTVTFKGTGTATDISGVTATSIFGSTIALSENGLLPWSGPASLEGFQTATAAEVEAALKAYVPDGSNHYGEDFYNWLVEAGVFNTDAAGTPRGAEGWWPGSYQNQ